MAHRRHALSAWVALRRLVLLALLMGAMGLGCKSAPQPSIVEAPDEEPPKATPPFEARAPSDTRVLIQLPTGTVVPLLQNLSSRFRLPDNSSCGPWQSRIEGMHVAITETAEVAMELPGSLTPKLVACLLGELYGGGALRLGPFVVTDREGGGIRVSTPLRVRDGTGAPASLTGPLRAYPKQVVAAGALGEDGELSFELSPEGEGMQLRWDQSSPKAAERLSEELIRTIEAATSESQALRGIEVQAEGATVVIRFGTTEGAALLGALRAQVFDVLQLNSESMLPTLVPGDMLLILRGSDGIVPGDLVAFLPPEGDEPMIKRVVAIAGQQVHVDAEIVSVNGSPLHQDLIEPLYVPQDLDPTQPRPPARLLEEVNGDIRYQVLLSPPGYGIDKSVGLRVPQGRVFTLGDYRDNSMDSRHFGAISVQRIIGKVAYILASFGDDGRMRWNRTGRVLLPIAG